MALKIRKAGGEQCFMRCMIYAEYGVGKTVLACSAADHPDMGKVLVLNLESGCLSVANKDGVDETEQIRCLADLEDIFWSLSNNDAAYRDYRTLVIDSASALYDMALTQRAIENSKASRSGKKSEEQISLQDYGQSNRSVASMLRNFRGLDRHVILTARSKSIYPEGYSAAKKNMLPPLAVMPDFPQGLATSLMHIMDHTWPLVMDEKTGKRYLLTQPNEMYEAKTRVMGLTKKLGVSVENPTMPMLFEALKETWRQ